MQIMQWKEFPEARIINRPTIVIGDLTAETLANTLPGGYWFTWFPPGSIEEKLAPGPDTRQVIFAYTPEADPNFAQNIRAALQTAEEEGYETHLVLTRSLERSWLHIRDQCSDLAQELGIGFAVLRGEAGESKILAQRMQQPDMEVDKDDQGFIPVEEWERRKATLRPGASATLPIVITLLLLITCTHATEPGALMTTADEKAMWSLWVALLIGAIMFGWLIGQCRERRNHKKEREKMQRIVREVNEWKEETVGLMKQEILLWQRDEEEAKRTIAALRNQLSRKQAPTEETTRTEGVGTPRTTTKAWMFNQTQPETSKTVNVLFDAGSPRSFVTEEETPRSSTAQPKWREEPYLADLIDDDEIIRLPPRPTLKELHYKLKAQSRRRHRSALRSYPLPSTLTLVLCAAVCNIMSIAAEVGPWRPFGGVGIWHNPLADIHLSKRIKQMTASGEEAYNEAIRRNIHLYKSIKEKEAMQQTKGTTEAPTSTTATTPITTITTSTISPTTTSRSTAWPQWTTPAPPITTSWKPPTTTAYRYVWPSTTISATTRTTTAYANQEGLWQQWTTTTPRTPKSLKEPTLTLTPSRRHRHINEGGSDVMWCSHKGGTLWTVRGTDRSPFCRPPPALGSRWIPSKVDLYVKTLTPKHIPHAMHCSVKKLKEMYYTNLLADKFTKPEREFIKITKDECYKIARQHECKWSKTPMVAHNDGSISSDDQLEVDFPGPIAGFFKGKQYAEAINCFAQPALLMYRPHTLELISPVHEVKHCHYISGACQLPDNTTLLWTPHCDGRCIPCTFEHSQQIQGEFTCANIGTPLTWISQDRQKALTFTDHPMREEACDGRRIAISEQGFGITEEQFNAMHAKVKQRRSVDPAQLASQLTAAQMGTNIAIGRLYQRECQRNVRQAEPTLQARKLLGKENIQARWVGPDTMEVFACSKLKLQEVEYRAVKECYRFIPVWVQHEGERVAAFLDPELRILSTTAQRADCEIHKFHYLQLHVNDSAWIIIDSQTGTAKRLPPSSVTELYESIVTDGIAEFHPLIFHQWALRNDSDEIPFPHIAELMRFEDFANRREQHETERVRALGALPDGVMSIWEDWLNGILQAAIQIWMKTACAYATFLFIRDIFIPLTCAYVLQPIVTTMRALIGKKATTVINRTHVGQLTSTMEPAMELAPMRYIHPRTRQSPTLDHAMEMASLRGTYTRTRARSLEEGTPAPAALPQTPWRIARTMRLTEE